MNQNLKNYIVNKSNYRKSFLFIVSFLFIIVSVTAVILYIHRLDNTFLQNTQFYMGEIAVHNTDSVDREIAGQWEKLKTIGNKLSLEECQSVQNLQNRLQLELKVNNFEEIILLDEQGNAYNANDTIKNISEMSWAADFLKNRKSFAVLNQVMEQASDKENNILYGVSIRPIRIGSKKIIGIAGYNEIETVKQSLKSEFFGGQGIAQVVGRDGTIITSEINETEGSAENLLKHLSNGKRRSGDSYESIKAKLAVGTDIDSVYRQNDQTILLTARPIKNAEWMVVVTVPVSVASGQTAEFLKITVITLSILCCVIGVVLFFSFISYKRTLVFKNSREIFYRERLFNLLAIHTDDVFIIEDAKTGTIHFISENVKRTLGVLPNIGEPVNPHFLPKEKLDQLIKEVEEMSCGSSKSGEHAELEFEWSMPKTEEKKWMHAAIYTAEADFTEKPKSCLLIVLSDYTQIKENQRKLEHAMKQAQDAAESKSMFLSNMSHEMRTPLNGIVGCIRLMKTHSNEPALLKEYLRKAEMTAKYLISLVNDILDMSKIESHKLILEEREVSLREICSNMETMFYNRMEEKGIQFSLNIEEPLYKVQGDEVRIQQILTNLLSNAQKFTNEGGKVTISVSQIVLKNRKIKTILCVTDTGIGMSHTFFERIWTPFEQERLDTARLHGGTGLGLAITHELVQLMNGTIHVSSEVGKGSTFIIELLQQNLGLDEGQQETIREVPIKEYLEGKTILIAEDNVLNQEILTTLLQEQEVYVICANNGKEAVEAFENTKTGKVDAILMDMQMPVMDGYTAARSIRKLHRKDAEKVIIIACTANAFQEDIDLAKEAGMDYHVAKPIDMEKLAVILNMLWEKNKD